MSETKTAPSWRELLREVMFWHGDPDGAEYNQCDTDPCQWCIEAQAALEHAREVRELRERVVELEEALIEAAGDVDDWGQYASDYFQTKHDLGGTVERYKTIAKGAKP